MQTKAPSVWELQHSPNIYLVAENIPDLDRCAIVALSLRRGGLAVDSPVSYTKPRKQISRAELWRAVDIVVIDGDNAKIKTWGYGTWETGPGYGSWEHMPTDEVAGFLEKAWNE